MAKNNRHNAAFVVGSVLGAVVGAGAALWKTPYTGEELRQKLASSGENETQTTETVRATPSTTTQSADRSMKDKLIAGVEKTLAPIVGVELGKTANGSGDTPPVVEDPGLKVNADAGQNQMLRRPYAWKGDEEAATSGGPQSLGLSQDRVDANEWAAAYSGGTVVEKETPAQETTSTNTRSANVPARTETPAESQAMQNSAEVSQARDAQGNTLIGLSRDRFDADRWAAAYGGTVDASSGNTTSTSSTEATDMARESAEQTGQGAKPAYPGDDGDAERHAPADRGASDSVTPVAQSEQTRDGRAVASDAATTEQLSSPQVHRTPDSAREVTERGMHPFPKLGGKE